MIAPLLFALVTAAMELRSADFTAGGTIPKMLMAGDCGGGNREPELTWVNPPPSARSFALVLHDPDAPVANGFDHWVVYNIPAGTRRLGSEIKLAADQQGLASTGKPAYYGPCPPPGPAHHYVFTLYALDVPHVGGKTPLSRLQLERQMAGHVVARAALTAMAAHP